MARRSIIEHVFDSWCDPPEIQILHRVDRAVVIYTHQVWPSASHSMTVRPANARGHTTRLPAVGLPTAAIPVLQRRAIG